MGHSYGRSSVVPSAMLRTLAMETVAARDVHHRLGPSVICTCCDHADDLVGCMELASIISMFRPFGRCNCSTGSR